MIKYNVDIEISLSLCPSSSISYHLATELKVPGPAPSRDVYVTRQA